jgi:ligand-binding sensor domain-containing protein
VWFAWYRELSNGVSKYDTTTKTWEETIVADWQEYTSTANMVNLGADDEEMWLGTDTGILFYDRATSGWSRSFNYPSELMGHVPPVCVLVEDNSVWFATSQGLGRLDRRLIDQIERIKQR